jgi:putative effector of murein hydrolase
MAPSSQELEPPENPVRFRTAEMLSINQTAGAFAGLAIGLTGLFTAVALPLAAYLL